MYVYLIVIYNYYECFGLPAKAPDTVPLPWQFNTRTLFTLAPRATPESRPLTTPAMCVP